MSIESILPAANAGSASLTERLGLAIMLRQPRIAAVAPSDDPVHLLNPEERAALQRIERQAIVRAAVAGALSALASSTTAIIAHRYYPIDVAEASRESLVAYWSWVLAVTVAASILEIAFLYWDALRTVHRMACAVGLNYDAQTARDRDADVVNALARAALELPNPLKPLFGIDPRREARPLFVAISSLIYKAKIALTTFLSKVLLRRMLGRAAARTLLELVAVPITAAWNAAVCRYVLNEARLRILGPSAIIELLTASELFDNASPQVWPVALRAAGSAVVRTRDFHPNHVALVRALRERVPADAVESPDDTATFFRELARLSATDQKAVLYVLVVAAVLDGRLTRAERRLLEEASTICGRPLRVEAIHSLAKAFGKGDPIIRAIHAAVDA